MISLPALWSTYEIAHLSRLAPKTQAAYRSVMRRAVKALPPQPSGADVGAWFDALPGEQAHRNYQLRVLQSVVRRGVELAGDGADIQRAVMAVRAPPAPPSKRCMPPADFLERVEGAARNRAERAWLRLVARGLRKGEMLGLRPEDIGDGGVTVCRQRGRPHRKNRIPYVVEVDAETLADLRWTIEHRTEVTPSFGRWNEEPTSAGCVFPWGETYLERFMARVRDHLGADRDLYLPRRKAWHQFRRRMARDAMERGESELFIANRLGDKSAAMARTYSDDGAMRNALPAARRAGLRDVFGFVLRWFAQFVRPFTGRMVLAHV